MEFLLSDTLPHLLHLLYIISREMLQPKFCLCAFTLGLLIPLITHGSPIASKQISVRSDAKQKSLAPRGLDNTANIPRTVRTRNVQTKSHPISKKDDAGDPVIKNFDIRYFMNPVWTIDKPSMKEVRASRDLPKAVNKNRQKRFLDIITGGGGDECGTFGCYNDGGTNTGEFEYGSDDGADYDPSRQGNDGYWRQCADDPRYECFYNHNGDTSLPRGYWVECVDNPDFECYYYNGETFAPLGYWDDCVDVEDHECYYYYDNWFSKWGCYAGGHYWDYYCGTFSCALRDSYEDQTTVDFFFKCSIFKLVVRIWFTERVLR